MRPIISRFRRGGIETGKGLVHGHVASHSAQNDGEQVDQSSGNHPDGSGNRGPEDGICRKGDTQSGDNKKRGYECGPVNPNIDRLHGPRALVCRERSE